tara:strand:+ start:7601 stop:7837 length:237 start_codon:yes stop_codon:yes gene_type:complete
MPESLLGEKGELSTGNALTGGKLLPIRWISLVSGFTRGAVESLSAGPALLSWEGMDEAPDLWTNPGASFGRRRRLPGL